MHPREKCPCNKVTEFLFVYLFISLVRWRKPQDRFSNFERKFKGCFRLFTQGYEGYSIFKKIF